MTLVWPPAGQPTLDQPRLHAFVIGVADYPHLNNGSGPLANDPLGLGQITAPEPTSNQIVNWLINHYNNPACPLGSVESVISPAGPVGGVPASAATMQNIRDAFKEWFNRCSKRRDNIAFFYFCGHGLNKDSQLILPQDFGDPSLPDDWANCIDFDGMRVGMRKCAAQTQVFFVDACRETPFGMLNAISPRGDPLVTATFSDSVERTAVYYATGEGRQAFAPSGGITYFAQALIECFDGLGTINSSGSWVVDTYSLSNALGQVLERMGRVLTLALTCNPVPTGKATLHIPVAPRVLAAVDCSTPQARSESNISLVSGIRPPRHSPPGQPRPWVEKVEPGDWTLNVTFATFPPVSQQETLMPPCFERTVPV